MIKENVQYTLIKHNTAIAQKFIIGNKYKRNVIEQLEIKFMACGFYNVNVNVCVSFLLKKSRF